MKKGEEKYNLQIKIQHLKNSLPLHYSRVCSSSPLPCSPHFHQAMLLFFSSSFMIPRLFYFARTVTIETAAVLCDQVEMFFVSRNERGETSEREERSQTVKSIV